MLRPPQRPTIQPAALRVVPAVRPPLALALAFIFALAGCASSVSVPDTRQTEASSRTVPPATWQAALPHGGSGAQLAAWWRQWGDAALVELMAAAQNNSASLSSARARIAQARAGLANANAALLPSVGASAQAARSVTAPNLPVATSLGAGLQAAWEIDLFGANREAANAEQARLEGAELGWHEARVALAAEVATTYYSLRYCEASAQVTQGDAASRRETARLADLTAQAGLNAPANAALARASAADAASNLRAAQAQCDVLVKALVALSALPEPELREKLKANQTVAQAISGQSAMFSIAQLPAELLTQRPDIAAAQRAVAAASAQARSANARRLPMLSLNGSLGVAALRQGGATSDGVTWSVGPIALSVPLLDGGRTAANTTAAVAAYDDAVVQLQAKVRTAVREVEEALVNLASVAARTGDAQAAQQGYKAALDAAQARYRAGLASLVELEDARRTALFAQQNTLALERDRIAAWISLYRAAGGGWRAGTPVAAAMPVASAAP